MLTLNPSGAFSVAPSGLGIGREGFGCGAVGSGSWGTRCCAIKTAHTETAPIQIRTNIRLIGSTPRFKFHCLHIVIRDEGKTQRTQNLAANYANDANGGAKQILDAPHSRHWRNSRLSFVPYT